MIPEIPMLSLGIFIVAIAGIAAWVYRMASRSNQKRLEELKAKKMYEQPWGADRADGRGNR